MAEKRDITEILKTRESDRYKFTRVTYALEYSEMAHYICRIINRHWQMIVHIPGCEINPRVGFEHSKNLRDVLIHSGQLQTTRVVDIPGHKKCGACSV